MVLAIFLSLASFQLSANDTVDITFLQINDVYEIAPSSDGGLGGLARVATVKNQLMGKNPNTILVLAGDFFGPSALSTARVNGEKLAGKQMVAVLNALGLDYATFGNHEFDLKRKRFYQRLREIQFTWISSNVLDKEGKLFEKVTSNRILEFSTPDGGVVKLGIFGVTIRSNRPDYVKISDPVIVAGEQVAILSEKVDILVALTHLDIEDDIRLANRYPQIDLIMGGHEHENIQLSRGPGFTRICKADANAISAYVHELKFDVRRRKLSIDSQLLVLDKAVPEDPKIRSAADKWLKIAFDGFRSQGFNPEKPVVRIQTPLDGLESSVRNRQTNLTEIVARGMLNAAPGTELAMFNSGSIRIDDTIQPGIITEYDVIRIHPFGGKILSVKMPGHLLKRVLDEGIDNRGKGGYLQTANVSLSVDSTSWQINGEELDLYGTYAVAINDFLLTGKERNLDFLNRETNSDLTVVAEHIDVRKSLIEQLKREMGGL